MNFAPLIFLLVVIVIWAIVVNVITVPPNLQRIAYIVIAVIAIVCIILTFFPNALRSVGAG